MCPCYTRKEDTDELFFAWTALLQSAMNEAAINGYKRDAVFFESQNSSGRNFWLKYFNPVCFSLVRKVDDRIAGAIF